VANGHENTNVVLIVEDLEVSLKSNIANMEETKVKNN
jgi:hypothetical protein